MRIDLIPSELRHAVRTLASGRLFTGVAIGCLTLGIAANTAMFSVFDAMFLRPPPFKDADRLVSIAGRNPQTGRRSALSLDEMHELAAARSLTSLAAYAGQPATLTDSGRPERIAADLVTANLFPMLGVQPQRGRGLDASDDEVSAARVVLISDTLWHRRYEAEPSVLGRTIRLDDIPYTVVGVMPPGFRFPSESELWIPATPVLGTAGAASRGMSVVGRLAPGMTLGRANTELATRVLRTRESHSPRTALARAFGRASIGSDEAIITGALMGATTLLLVLACVNLANLLLARGLSRRQEIAVRVALGATRWRIARQLLLEALLLAAAAGAIAVPLARYGIWWLHQAVPPSDPLGPYYMTWSLDIRTLLYALTVALATGILSGIVPVLVAASRRPANPLRERAGSAGGRTQRRIHGGLIVAQMALALVLLASAWIFVRTYVGLSDVTLGYDVSHLMTMRVDFAGAAYDAPDARARAVDELASRLEALPVARGATVTDLVPLDDQGGADARAIVDGRAFAEGREPTVQYAGVAGDWLEALDVRLLSGRTFSAAELRSRAAVALVNARLAETFWPGERALGRRFRLVGDAPSPWLTVIGVVPDIRTVKLDENRLTPPTAYLPHRFIATRNWGIVVRSRSTPEAAIAGMRAAVRQVDPSLAVFDAYPMAQVRWLSYWMYAMWGEMFGVLGAVAFVMAAVGVYAVVFYTVAQRKREIGLRMALGARRLQVVWPVLRHVGGLSAIGLVVGLFGARVSTPVVGSLLIGVSPTDPAGLLAVSLTLVAVALVAAWIPAWSISAVDPKLALRDE